MRAPIVGLDAKLITLQPRIPVTEGQGKGIITGISQDGVVVAKDIRFDRNSCLEDAFFIGRGYMYPAALEGALSGRNG